jgi:2'-5' RNA ligase
VTSSGGPSALIAEIPEAEPLVGRWRARLDVNARLGIPAHVTVMYPFVPARDVDAVAGPRLADLFGAVPSFGFRLDRVGWFGEDTVWLGPREPAPFRALTERVLAEFPAYPPFEGHFSEVIPHLTVGHQQPVADLRAAEEAVRARLPVDGVVRAVSLWTEGDDGHWQRAASFGLG